MNIRTACTEALRSYEAQDYAAVIRFCQQGLYQAPAMAELHYLSAYAYWKQGKRDEARRILETASKYVGGDRFLLLLSAMREENGDLQGAVETLRAAKESHLSVRFNLAALLTRQGEIPNAIQGYQEILRQEPDSVPALNNLGALLAALGDPDGAIVCFERAQKVCPSDPISALNLAREWARKGELKHAEGALRQVLELAEEMAEVHALAGWIYEHTDRQKEAVRAYERALRLGLDTPELHEAYLRTASMTGT